MNEFLLIMVYLLGIVQGIAFGYMKWAFNSPFKEGFIKGITLGFLRSK